MPPNARALFLVSPANLTIRIQHQLFVGEMASSLRITFTFDPLQTRFDLVVGD